MPISKTRSASIASAAAVSGFLLMHSEQARAIPWNLPEQAGYFQAYKKIKPLERDMQKNNSTKLGNLARQKGWQSITLEITLKPKSPPFYPYNLIERDITAVNAHGKTVDVNYPGLVYDRTTPLLPKGYRLPKASGSIIDARIYKTYCATENNYIITLAARLPKDTNMTVLGITPLGKLPGGYTALSPGNFTNLFGAAAYNYMLHADSPNVGPNGLGRIPAGAKFSAERCGAPEKAQPLATPIVESHGIVSIPLPPTQSSPIGIAPPAPLLPQPINGATVHNEQLPTPLFITPMETPALPSTPSPVNRDPSKVGHAVDERLNSILKGLAR